MKSFSFAKKSLYRIARKNQFPGMEIGILGLLGWREVKVFTHDSLAIKSGELFTASTSTIAAPRQPLSQNSTLTSFSPPIRWYLLSESLISAYSVGIWQSDAAVLPRIAADYIENHRSDEGGMYITGGKIFQRKTPKITIEMDAAILCGGLGSFNYYHFALECLPKVWMSNRLPDEFSELPIILPKECESIHQFKDLVNLMAPNRRKLYLNPEDLIRVKRVLVFDESNYGPFNMPYGRWPALGDYHIHDVCMSLFIQQLRSSVLSHAKHLNWGRRIFISRPQKRRSYNQCEIVSLAKRYGFQVIYPETLDIASQAAVFNSASVIAGASGAAWVGLAFCEPGTQAISWLPPEYFGFCSYATLAYKMNVDLYYIQSDYFKPLRSTYDAYGSTYAVDLSSLGRSLELLIENSST